jgi:hypothetical protein
MAPDGTIKQLPVKIADHKEIASHEEKWQTLEGDSVWHHGRNFLFWGMDNTERP